MEYVAHQLSQQNPAGVYGIFSLSGEGLYIGCTKDTRARFYSHLIELRGNRHHCQSLQDYYNQQGEADFIFSVMEACPAETKRTELTAMEAKHIDRFAQNKAFRILNYVVSGEPKIKPKKAPRIVVNTTLKKGCDSEVIISRYAPISIVKAFMKMTFNHTEGKKQLSDKEVYIIKYTAELINHLEKEGFLDTSEEFNNS